MNKKLTILQTPVRFYPANGGVENHVLYLGKELVKQGYNMNVICADGEYKDEVIEGISVRRLPSAFKFTNTNITAGLPAALWSADFDIVHTHMPTPWSCDWSILIAKLRRKKSIVTIHNDMHKEGFFSKLVTVIYLNTAFRISLALVDRIIIVNPDWENSFVHTKQLLKTFKHKISVIENGIDTSLFVPQEQKKPYELLCVSILDKYHVFKGIDYLIEAIPAIKKIFPAIHLTIVGEGELKETFMNQADKLGVTENITFAGYKTQEELPAYYSRSQLFILPSVDTEGYGIVLLESLACATPVVTTSIAGLSSVVQSQNLGRIVESKNPSAIADAVVSLLSNNTSLQTMRAKARDYIVSHYSWEHIAQQASALYQSL